MSEASERMIEARVFARKMLEEGPRGLLPSRKSRAEVEEAPNKSGGGPEKRATR